MRGQIKPEHFLFIFFAIIAVALAGVGAPIEIRYIASPFIILLFFLMLAFIAITRR